MLGRRGLPSLIKAPAGDLPVLHYSAGVFITSTHHVEFSSGRRRLAVVISNPAGDRTVSQTPAGVEPTSVDRDEGSLWWC